MEAMFFTTLTLYGAGSGNRTRTLLPELDFESSASTYSATPARGTSILHTSLILNLSLRTNTENLKYLLLNILQSVIISIFSIFC